MIIFSLRKAIEPIGILNININEINAINIKYIKKSVFILNPINNVKAIVRFIIAFLELVKKIANIIPKEEVIGMMKEALQIEEEFICESISGNLIGMNCDLMKQYIHHIADRLLVQFGYSKMFYETNPFTFMNKISLDGKTNFFEQRVSEYNLVNKHEEEQIFQFDLSEEF